MAPVKKVTAGGAILALIAGLFSFVFFMQPAAAVGTQTFNPTADTYVQADLPDNNFGSKFRVWRGTNEVGELSLRVPGVHNVYNALAAIAG